MSFQVCSVTTIGRCVERNWTIVIACGECRHELVWDCDLLAGMVPHMSIQDIAAKVSCGQCGCAECSVYHRPMAA